MTAVQTALGNVEEWRPIPSAPGYEASSAGRIRSLDRLDTVGRPVVGRVLSQSTHPVTGYVSTAVYRGALRCSSLVHRLVAEAFIGPCPQGMEVSHNDGVRSNNAASNLRYATHSENERDKRRHGTDHQANKTHCPAGHAYDARNTYVGAKGWRRCRRCRADGMARRRTRALAAERGT